MILAHKIELDLTDRQATKLARAAGSARFAYNWALAEWKRQAHEWWESGRVLPYPTAYSLSRQLNAIKREKFPWMYDSPVAAVETAILRLGAAFKAFREGRAKYPKPKRRGARVSFCAGRMPNRFSIDGKRLRISVIGWVRLVEPLRLDGELKSLDLSLVAGRWYASLTVDCPELHPVNTGPSIGVDLGVAKLATLSNGEVAAGPKARKAALQRLRRANKTLARRQRGSQRWLKARRRLQRVHARIGNVRSDALHKLTTDLTQRFSRIGIEDLNVRGLVRNRRLARSIMDGSFSRFRRMLEYKAKLYGSEIVVADRWFPSSKTCSCCGSVKETLALSERVFVCTECGFTADRDLNAALNLEKLAASSAVSVRGDRSSGGEGPALVAVAGRRSANSAAGASNA